MLESTLAAGLCSVGADVELLGVIPTPGVAYLVRKYHADAGIMISASHNPMEFNGIKIFKGDGYKLPDEVENQIEAHVFNNCTDIRLAEGADIGRIKTCRTGVKDYVDFLQEHIDADLTGLKVAVRLRQRRFRQGRAGICSRALAASAASSAPSRTVFPSTTAAAPPIWKRWKRPSSRAATIAASPLTVTRTAAWPATKTAPRSTVTRSSHWSAPI